MHAVLADPAIYGFTGGDPPTLEQLRARYAHQARGISPDGHERWLNWVVRERATGRAAGFVQATIELATGVADVAWVVTPACQGRGLAREAATAMVAWLCDGGRASAIVAHVHPEHHASGAVAAAVGLAPTARWHAGEVRWELSGDRGAPAGRRSGREDALS